MVPLIPYTADELMQMDELRLREVRGEFFTRLDRETKKPVEVHEAILDVMQRFTMLQEMAAWRPLAEPGIAAKMLDVGEDWSDAIETAREIDRHSVEAHSEAATEFERLGGKAGLDAAIRRLNAFAEP